MCLLQLLVESAALSVAWMDEALRALQQLLLSCAVIYPLHA